MKDKQKEFASIFEEYCNTINEALEESEKRARKIILILVQPIMDKLLDKGILSKEDIENIIKNLEEFLNDCDKQEI